MCIEIKNLPDFQAHKLAKMNSFLHVNELCLQLVEFQFVKECILLCDLSFCIALKFSVNFPSSIIIIDLFFQIFLT